ncbi:hypothetical protein [Methylobacterium indicum]|uniref:Uncharacterized protein n=1 Tax=Methylobacterium indicum TaxID=1775910 RepID=A0ABR5HFK4_9HYPH|nr:hypothetical protein [Methylobacterium indicum]KMO18870.1 hypothetical protein QR78_14210 [Methylobacterium indicum]KMO25028.1 hypothetical protein QR79_09600 [Methylobacterium indicum]
MGEILRHKKTGGLYEVLFRGAVIHSDVPLSDDAPIIVCRRIPDGQIVARFGPTPRGSFDVLHHSRLQTDALIHDGAEVVVYRAVGGAPVWVRRASEMDDGRFEPAEAPQPPSSTPGEVERLVDALSNAAWEMGHSSSIATKEQMTVVRDALRTARTALLSHISTAGRGEGAGDLWCVHILGPDDVYAAPDLMTAVRWAQTMNRVADRAEQKIANRQGRPLTDDERVLCYANVVAWPRSAADHAGALPSAIQQMEPRTPPAPPSADAITNEASRLSPAEIAEGRAVQRQALAFRLQCRLDAMTERGMESVGISKGFAAELVHALSAADATNPQDQE